MNDDGAAGCFGLIFMIGIGWLIVHFSGVAVLYSRSEEAAKTLEYGQRPYLVTCSYLASTGSLRADKLVYGDGARDAYYCPRWKRLGD